MFNENGYKGMPKPFFSYTCMHKERETEIEMDRQTHRQTHTQLMRAGIYALIGLRTCRAGGEGLLLAQVLGIFSATLRALPIRQLTETDKPA